MLTYAELKARALADPAVRAEYERLAAEFAALRAKLERAGERSRDSRRTHARAAGNAATRPAVESIAQEVSRMERVTKTNWLTCDAEAFLRRIDYGTKPLPADWLAAAQDADEDDTDEEDEHPRNGWQRMAQDEHRAKRGKRRA